MNDLLKILKISTIICLVIVLTNSLFGIHSLEQLLSWELWGTYFFYSAVLTAINTYYFTFFRKKIGWEQAGIKRVILASVGSIILTLAGYFFCRLVDHTLFQGRPIDGFLSNEQMNYYILPLLFTAIISLFFHLVYFYRALQEQRVTE